MSAVVRGKFKVTEITRRHWNTAAAEVKLEAQYTGSAEDNTYSEATPQASISMTITNAAAVDKLPLGASFYVDFIPVDPV
jgi:hypothetical protein